MHNSPTRRKPAAVAIRNGGNDQMIHVGIDIGGTFTDLFAWDTRAEASEHIREAKVLTTPGIRRSA